MRRRWYQFCQALTRRALKAGEMSDDVMIEAVADTFEMDPMHGDDEAKLRKRQLRKAKSLLRKPDIRSALSDVFEMAAEFDVIEAAQIHVKHIRGEMTYEEQVVLKDGEIVTVTKTLPPSLEALKLYHKMTQPEPAKTVNINQRTLQVTANLEDAIKNQPATMQPRVIGKAIIESGD